jgi:hypothetical protein
VGVQEDAGGMGGGLGGGGTGGNERRQPVMLRLALLRHIYPDVPLACLGPVS